MGYFGNYYNAGEVLIDYAFVERRRSALDPLNDNGNVLQDFFRK